MIAHLWTRHRRLLLATVAALALAVFFGVRAVLFGLYWTGHRDEAIAGWMTPRYVAMSWGVPPEVVGEALAIAPDGGGRRITLADLADQRGTNVEALGAEVAAAIAQYRASQ